MQVKITMEANSPSSQRTWPPLKDKFISNFPNIPTSTSHHFLEARSLEGVSSRDKLSSKIIRVDPNDPNRSPTSIGKLTVKE
jgi:hypothetical protein